MTKTLRKVAILGGTRTPFTKSFGAYKDVSNQELLTATLSALVKKFQLQGHLLGDVTCGSVVLHSKDFNLTRECVLGTELDPRTPANNLQRACGTGLDAANTVGLKIASGQIEVGIAGGSDTNSDTPINGSRELVQFLLSLRDARSIPERLKALASFRPSILMPKFPTVSEPRTGLSMGDHCELMVKEWKISRDDQDQLAFESHQKAAKAYGEGFYNDNIFSFKGLDKDSITRADTTVEKLAKLKPAFDKSEAGTLTAGNSTPLTDGASAVLLSSEEWAANNKMEPLAYLVDTEVAALDFVHGEGLLMAPTLAVARLLKRNNLTLQDFDLYEIHEAFAGQVLCTLKAWEDEKYCQTKLGMPSALGKIDRAKMNQKGSSLATGHPFAATGGRILASMAKQLHQKGKGRGLISICTAGGMGIASIVERL
ncbi:MAG: acetyl-CoA C-acetyltransferase [Bacteriovoracaceae bacterium]|nr:acetyl-CoA C-acetyltransferase [Bacteriovoracaceae bacterium]